MLSESLLRRLVIALAITVGAIGVAARGDVTTTALEVRCRLALVDRTDGAPFVLRHHRSGLECSCGTERPDGFQVIEDWPCAWPAMSDPESRLRNDVESGTNVHRGARNGRYDTGLAVRAERPGAA